MNFDQVQKQLLDLPRTFTRPDQVFAQWIDSLTAALEWYCQASDTILSELNFNDATDGWLDVWGTLVGIARASQESNPVYQNRIRETILAWRDSAVAIEEWIRSVFDITTTVTENLPLVGYNVSFPSSTTLAHIRTIVASLAYVRPAGVPFTVSYDSTGMYLNTVDYFASSNYNAIPPIGRATGQYLGGAIFIPLDSALAATDNVVSLLPSLMFEDPTLNPPLA